MQNYDDALQQALIGNSKLSISNVFSEAWEKVHGIKASFWGGFGLYFVIALAVMVIVGIITGIVSVLLLPTEEMRQAAAHGQTLAQMPVSYIIFQLVMQLVQIAITVCIYFPMLAGLMLIGIRWINAKSVSAFYVTKFFTKAYIWRFFLIWLGMTLAVLIPMFIVGALAAITAVAHLTLPLKALLITVCVLLVLLVIYLMAGFFFAMPLIVDRFLKGWEALNVSRKVVTHHWFRVFFLFLFMGIIVTISAMLILIPLIWTMPWAYNVIAVAYRDLFGIAGKDPVSLE